MSLIISLKKVGHWQTQLFINLKGEWWSSVTGVVEEKVTKRSMEIKASWQTLSKVIDKSFATVKDLPKYRKVGIQESDQKEEKDQYSSSYENHCG